MSATPSPQWINSSQRNPCPICGRTKDGDCRISSDGQHVICHHPKDLRPGEVQNGWAFTGYSTDGRGGHFTPDKPKDKKPKIRRKVIPFKRPAAPAPIPGPIEQASIDAVLPKGSPWIYSQSKRIERIDNADGRKLFVPRHHDGQQWAKGAGPDPWPVFGVTAPGWVLELEGEKCCEIALEAGVGAISQPGHAHKVVQIADRYRDLQAGGVMGIVYLADNDTEGKRRAEQAASAAAQVQLPLVAVRASEVWQDLPAGGSIDDAPGTAAERVAAIVQAVMRQQQEKEQEPEPEIEQEPDLAPYRVLGWCSDRSRVFYQYRQTGQIASIKPASQPGSLLQLALIGWWKHRHPGEKGPVDWAAACSDVIEQANRANVFALEGIRGRGVWMEGDRVVWHLGDRLEVDGQEVALIEHRSTHHYPRLPQLDVERTVEPLSDAEGREILTAVEAMGWATPLDPLHLLGWVVLANVGGALEKRPALQITSRFGSGKTFTRERVLQPLLAGLAISRSNSTEAGIRQLLKADTLPVLIDESEGEDQSRREGHLRLARLSYDGSPTDRGTTHGQALSYAIRSSVAMVGINATITNPAVRSRTVLVGREQVPQAEWAPVDRRLQELLTPKTGARLLRRAVNHLPTLRAKVATFRRAVEGQLGGGAAARAGDTYGALLAGAHLLVSTAAVDDTEAVQWLDSIGWSATAALGETGSNDQDGTAESRQCLAHLLSHEETWRADDTGTGRLSIRELLDLARTSSGADDAEEARKALGRRGIRATASGLEVANRAEALAPIYGKTKWHDGGHRARLLDLPGAYAAGMVRFPVLGPNRASKLPWELLA